MSGQFGTDLFWKVCLFLTVIAFVKGTDATENYKPLHEAVVNNNIDEVSKIFQNGVNPNVPDPSSGMTPLMKASKLNYFQIVGILIDKGADVGTKDKKGWCALHHAALKYSTESVDVLLQNNAKVDCRNAKGGTPLMIAAKSNSLEVAKLLLKSQANVDAANNEGYTALMVAAQFGNTEIAKMLIEHGANIEATEHKYDSNILSIAVIYNHLPEVKLLIQNGADVNKKTKTDFTPLMLAASYKTPECTEVLIENGAKLNEQDQDEMTALHCAAHFGSLIVTEILIQNGADKEILDKEGKTALDTARYSHHNDIALYLMDACGLPPPECRFPFTDGNNQYNSCTNLAKNNMCSCMDANDFLYQCRAWNKVCANDEYEFFDYSIFHPYHSVIYPRRPECKKKESGITEEEKEFILKQHNEKRSKVAKGEENPQPKAANMKELTWNNELAYIAQKWADVCIFSHEKYFPPTNDPNEKIRLCSRNYMVGENLYYHSNPNLRQQVWQRAIDAWYGEVVNVPVSLVPNYDPDAVDSTKQIGHYTQMVWADTYEIGCGAVYFKEGGYPVDGKTTLDRGTILVCDYGPAGNIENRPIYKTGETASRCGEPGRSKTYPSLCASTYLPTR